ncbi:MAG TPA: hypothetical protein VHA37_04385 [Candidatus Saccharimonadales bacterium]|nr:hypothetical protein [Candidatus Saccharimonadales bacterium]
MSDPILEAKEMEDLEPLAQAKKAIGHALRIIRENPQVGWHMGAGTQSFALLTEAYATLTEQHVRQVRERCMPRPTGPSDTELVREIRRVFEDWQAEDRAYPGGSAALELAKKMKHLFGGEAA